MNCHYRFYELEDFFKNASKLGFHYAEIWTGPQHFYMDYQGYEDVNKLTSLEKKYHLQIVSICPEQTNPKPNNMAIKGLAQERVYRYFCNAVDVAKQVGAKLIVITSGWAFHNEYRKEAFKRSVQMIKRVCEYANKSNIMVAIEALQKFESNIANTRFDLKEIVSEVDNGNLKICLDLGAMAGADETIPQYFDTFGKEIIHSHFVDGDPIGHLAWGDGTRNMKNDLSVFHSCGYEGVLSLESVNERYYEYPFEADEQTMKLYRQITEGKL